MLTQDRLRECLSYDKETGLFTWLVTQGNAAAGDRAGYRDSLGYVRVGIDGKYYLAHRLAWLHMYGEMPQGILDHINRDRADNRIVNLRGSNARANALNTGLYASSSSGVKGVHLYKRTGRWSAHIMVRGKTVHLGSFANFDDAVAARKAAEMKATT